MCVSTSQPDKYSCSSQVQCTLDFNTASTSLPLWRSPHHALALTFLPLLQPLSPPLTFFSKPERERSRNIPPHASNPGQISPLQIPRRQGPNGAHVLPLVHPSSWRFDRREGNWDSGHREDAFVSSDFGTYRLCQSEIGWKEKES